MQDVKSATYPTIMAEEARSYGAFLARLCRTGQFDGIAKLWEEALPWLCEVMNALGAVVTYEAPPKIKQQYGEIPAPVQASIKAWRQQIRYLQAWMPPAASPISTPPVLLAIESPVESYPLYAIPLWDDNTLVGGVVFVLRERPTTELAKQYVGLIEAVVQIASLSTQLRKMHQRLTHLTLFYDIGQKLTSSLDLREVLHETTALAASVLDADASTLMLVDEKTQELVFEIPIGAAGGVLQQQRIPITQGIAGWVATHGEPVICNDTGHDERFDSQVDAKTGYSTRSVLCVPLQVKGRIIGVLEVLNKRQPEGFNQQDMEWLSTLGVQAAIAIENARLYEDLRREQERIIRVQEQERHALAQALHDGPTATLGAIIMGLHMAQRLLQTKPERIEEQVSYLLELAQAANKELRQKLFELRPVIMQTRGLLAALRSYATQQQETSSFQLHMDLPDSLPELNTTAAEAVFAIIQEAVRNVRKHAQAKNCWVHITTSEEPAVLIAEVEDDGTGFDVHAVERNYEERGSLGLLSMRERAELLGARFTIASPRPNHANGTLVRLEIPMDRLVHAPRQKSPAS
ncbi:MAG: GAF domain-containing sensor histidine kinase [Anaerolineae bacterium]|nr:GAF domain-containing sensor histidine kinase [Anaerolineae bacterium]